MGKFLYYKYILKNINGETHANIIKNKPKIVLLLFSSIIPLIKNITPNIPKIIGNIWENIVDPPIAINITYL